MIIYNGDINIDQDNLFDPDYIDKVEIINGNVEIHKGYYAKFSKLKQINGWFTIWDDAKADVPFLRSVSDSLSICNNVLVDFQNLEYIGGDLKCWDNSTIYAKKLIRVFNSVVIFDFVKTDLSFLQVIGKNLIIYNSSVNLSNLIDVGGRISISSEAGVEMKSLNKK